MDLREHVRMLVAFVGVAPLAKAAGVPVIQVTRALHSGKATPHAQMALSRLELPDLGECSSFNSKGVRLRLRALYAMGYTTPVLAEMLETGHRQVQEIIKGERDWVRAPVHNRAKRLFDGVGMAPEPEGNWADNARERARARGWLKPIELEEDLIDVPEPWAGRMLAHRAQEMDFLDLGRCRRAYREGDRSELVVAGYEVYKVESLKRRKSRKVAAHGSC